MEDSLSSSSRPKLVLRLSTYPFCHGGTGLDVLRRYILPFQPGLYFFASELRAIVASEVFGVYTRPFLRPLQGGYDLR